LGGCARTVVRKALKNERGQTDERAPVEEEVEKSFEDRNKHKILMVTRDNCRDSLEVWN
jgi:hypothetical protein